jgi:cyanophycinase-like exopeptidase
MPDRPAALYLLAGGRGAARPRGPDPLLQAALRRTGVRRPTGGWIGAACGDEPAARRAATRALRSCGAAEVLAAPLCGRRADPGAARHALQAADIVFLSGGDVAEGMRVLRAQKMIGFLRGLFASGKPFAGVSAGSIMLARRWVRWDDPRDEGSASLFPCLGFARLLCDTHGEREHWQELAAALALSPPGATGYGIVTGSALVVETDGSLAALGGEVQVYRKRGSAVGRLESLLPRAQVMKEEVGNGI